MTSISAPIQVWAASSVSCPGIDPSATAWPSRRGLEHDRKCRLDFRKCAMLSLNRRFGTLLDKGGQRVHKRQEDVLLAGEVMIERALGRVRCGDDVIHTRPVVTLRREDLNGGGQEPVTCRSFRSCSAH